MDRDTLNLQFNGVIVVPHGGSISPFGLRHLNQQSVKSQGQKGRILLMAVVSGATLISTP